MKKYFFIFLFLFLCVSFLSHAQTKIDSLKKELRQNLSSLQKAKINYNLAVEYYSKNLQESKKYFEAAEIYLNQTQKNDELTIKFYNKKGSLFTLLNKYKESDSLLDLSISYAIKNQIKPKYYKINAETAKALNQFYQGKRKLALKLYDSLEIQSQELDSLVAENANLKAVIATNKAIVLANSGRLSEALKYFKIRMNYMLKTIDYDDTSKITSLITSINNTALCSEMLNMTDDALTYYIKALDLAKKHKITIEINRIYLNLSRLFSNQSEFKKSIEYASLVNSTENNINFSAYNNIGISYLNLKEYAKSVNYLQKALELAKVIKRPGKTALIYSNLGLNFLELGKFDKAILNLEKAKKIYIKIGDKKRVSHMNEGLARVYLRMKNYQRALPYALKAEEYMQTSKITEEVTLQNKNNLYLIYKNLGKVKEALNWLEIKEQVEHKHDSIRHRKDVNDLETKYQTQQKENEILKLSNDNIKKEAEAKTKSTQLTYSLFGGGAILLLSLFTLRAYRKEKKSKEQIELQKQEIETLHKEVHHRVKNNLAVAKSFTSIAKENVHDKKGQEALNALQSRIDSMANIHEILYKQDNISAVNFQNYTERICEEISKAFDGKNRNISYSVDANIQIPINEAIPLGLILNEAVTNSFKYAFKEKGNISIHISEQNNEIKCAISDDGIGIPKDLNIEELNSYGMELMQTLVMQLEGSMEIKNNNGTQINITIPIS